MSTAMGSVIAAMVATVVPMEALLFTAIDEQQHTTDCAQAVVESIAAEFWSHPVAAPRDPEKEDLSMSVAQIHALLDANSIANRAFWMSWEDVTAAVERYGPSIVHFEEPDGHYAVAVGALGEVREDAEHLLIADPARGNIIVSRSWWRKHASGATVVVDTNWDRATRDKHLKVADARLRRLEVTRNDM